MNGETVLTAYIFRIILACVCGGIIGLERTKRSKEAGIRTHCIIASTAALLMIEHILPDDYPTSVILQAGGTRKI